ncbi:MAG TPA: multicopper oxidase domain-containing protein, partial [Caldilineaceae bacterium]|nr:multicopper oxidase domain-containing protein [Caldilineaceae bacterium]
MLGKLSLFFARLVRMPAAVPRLARVSFWLALGASVIVVVAWAGGDRARGELPVSAVEQAATGKLAVVGAEGADLYDAPDGVVAASLALAPLFPAWARSGTGGAGDGTTRLEIAQGHFSSGGGSAQHAITVNGSTPGPLIRLREGETARFAVANRLGEQTSIH